MPTRSTEAGTDHALCYCDFAWTNSFYLNVLFLPAQAAYPIKGVSLNLIIIMKQIIFIIIMLAFTSSQNTIKVEVYKHHNMIQK